MWAELFLDNRDNVLFELDSLAEFLAQYRAAVENNDLAALTALLDEGRRRQGGGGRPVKTDDRVTASRRIRCC